MALAEPKVRPLRPLLWLMVIVMTAAACSSSEGAEAPTVSSDAGALEASVLVPNQGGSLEGHTPRGFAGSGVGLFAGDELNANFPADDGVQIWLTFDVPDGAPASSVILQSDALTVRGNPFETLGALEIAPVQYDSFGPQVVALEPIGAALTCPLPEDGTFSCDVTDAVLDAVNGDAARVQFRLRFEETSDPDGEQDLAMFFLTDSNTNEPGIFHLVLS